MSQCVSCNNQPNDNDGLGGGMHEGAVTPMVIGIIVGTVAVFVLVVVALFYCVRLENNKYMSKMGSGGESGSGAHDEDVASAKSRPSSVTVVPSGVGEPRVAEVNGAGGKRRLFGWSKKEGGAAHGPADNTPVTAIEMV